MIWFISEHHQAAYDALNTPKGADTARTDANLTETVGNKALAKLVQVGLVDVTDDEYSRVESEGADTVGSYA